MKIFIAVVAIFLINTVSAINLEISNSYSQKETAIGKISGEILQPINKYQVKLKKDNVNLAFDYDVKKIGENYYLWLITPQSSGDYKIIIDDIITRVNGNLVIVDYEKTFSVSSNITDYSVKPGFVSTSQDFYLTVTLNRDSEKTISANYPESRQITLRSGENRIYFSTANSYGVQFIMVQVGKYSIPTYLIKGNAPIVQNNTNQTENNFTMNNTSNETNFSIGNITTNNTTSNVSIQNNFSTEKNQSSNISRRNYSSEFRFNPGLIRATILITENLPTYTFSMINSGKENLSDVFLDYDKNKFRITPEESITIEPNMSKDFNLTLKQTDGSEIKDAILAFSGNGSDFMILMFNFTIKAEDARTDYIENKTTVTGLFSCLELAGVVCQADETCSGDSVQSAGGISCCVSGVCKKQSTGSKAWIGWLLAGLGLIIVVYIYLKYRKAKVDKSPTKSSGKF